VSPGTHPTPFHEAVGAISPKERRPDLRLTIYLREVNEWSCNTALPLMSGVITDRKNCSTLTSIV